MPVLALIGVARRRELREAASFHAWLAIFIFACTTAYNVLRKRYEDSDCTTQLYHCTASININVLNWCREGETRPCRYRLRSAVSEGWNEIAATAHESVVLYK